MSTQTYGTQSGAVGSYPQQSARKTFTVSKSGSKASEFFLVVAAIAVVLIAPYVDGDDTLTQDNGWRYAIFVAIAYIVSRGLVKLATREPDTDGR